MKATLSNGMVAGESKLQAYLGQRLESSTKERVAALYSKLPNKERFQEAYRARVNLWKLILLECIRRGIFAQSGEPIGSPGRSSSRKSNGSNDIVDRCSNGSGSLAGLNGGITCFYYGPGFDEQFIKFGHRPLDLTSVLLDWHDEEEGIQREDLFLQQRVASLKLSPTNLFYPQFIPKYLFKAASQITSWAFSSLIEEKNAQVNRSKDLLPGLYVCNAALKEVGQVIWPIIEAQLYEMADRWVDWSEFCSLIASALQHLNGLVIDFRKSSDFAYQDSRNDPSIEWLLLSRKDAGALLMLFASQQRVQLYPHTFHSNDNIDSTVVESTKLELYAQSYLIYFRERGIPGKSCDIPLNSAIELVHLKQSIRQLKLQQNYIEKQIFRCRQSAKEQLKCSNKRAAINCISRIKLLEQSLQANCSGLEQLEQAWMAIKQAHSNVQILRALESGMASLKEYQRAAGIDSDGARDIVDSWASAAADVGELDSMLNERLNSMTESRLDIDERQLQEELDGLTLESAHESATNSAPVEFPNVPIEPVGQSKRNSNDKEKLQPTAL